MIEDVVERLARVETIVEHNGKRIDDLEGKNDLLTRLTIVSEQQAEFNKEFKQEAKEFRLSISDFKMTIEKVNTNLDGLNKKFETIDQRVGTLEGNKGEQKIEKLDERISEIETNLQDNKKTKLGILKYVGTSVATVVITLLIAYMSMKLGLTK